MLLKTPLYLTLSLVQTKQQLIPNFPTIVGIKVPVRAIIIGCTQVSTLLPSWDIPKTGSWLTWDELGVHILTSLIFQFWCCGDDVSWTCGWGSSWGGGGACCSAEGLGTFSSSWVYWRLILHTTRTVANLLPVFILKIHDIADGVDGRDLCLNRNYR